MSSYYETVAKNLSPSKIADSDDINEIQTNIQIALANMIKDTFGEGCILDDDEDALKIYPTPDHIDQVNKNYDEDDNLISFYDRYFRQKIYTEKSEIQSIRLQMINNSDLNPTIFAEIRDSDMNLLKVSNTKLKSTVTEDHPIDVEFTFNLTHLAIGEYYFVLRPVDITSIDMEQGNYDIDSDMFKVRYDRGGNYNEDLQSSYNGVDYFDANLLEDQILDWDGNIGQIYDNNFDLYFEQVFSAGNTYLINPAACMVMGEKTYPVDTHVTIDGPSKHGDRIDLVTLTEDGLLHVTSGAPYTGTKKEENYPVNTAGLKIAYITVYQNSSSFWICPNCETVNDGNIGSCSNCDTSINTKIPLIEQDDENGITRQRNILERLRRLEKKLDYQIQNNIPSRIKYTCDVDPTMAMEGQKVLEVGADGSKKYRYVYGEDTYKMGTDKLTEDDVRYLMSVTDLSSYGDTILTFNDNIKETYAWSIVNKITTTKTIKKNISATLSATNLILPVKKPSKVKNTQLFTIEVHQKKVTTTNTVKQTSTKTNTTTTTSQYTSNAGIADISVDVYIKNKKGTTIKTLKNQKTNSKGKIQLDLWSKYTFKKGTYTIVTQYGDKKISNVVIFNDKGGTVDSGKKEIGITITSTTDPVTSVNVGSDVITGNDSFYTNNMKVDTENGEVYISKVDTTDAKKTTWYNITKEERQKAKSSTRSFKINSSTTSQQSTYAMLNLNITNDCTIYDITPYIKSFTNINKFKIVLFKNDKIFNLNTGRSSYEKKIYTSKAKTTAFPNIYASSWVEVSGTTKNGVVTPKKQHTFSLGDNGKKINKGTYSLLIVGTLKDKKKDGTITITQYHTNNITKHGSLTDIKGTYNPNTVFIETNTLKNKTSLVTMQMVKHTFNTTGTLISKTINTTNNIRSCKVIPNYEIPIGSSCDIETYVSNNGGKSYTLVTNHNNTVNFTGLGHEFRWRIIFYTTNKSQTPKLKFNGKYAIKFELAEAESYVGYEDYGRCFATPMMNANAITQSLARNENIENKFEEWEYCRLWMEDEDLGATMDICFAYDNDNYSTNTSTKQASWPSTIFFSQVLSNLTVNDFSQTSIDYSNYTADVEYDENNFRLKYDINTQKSGDIIVATPLSAMGAENYNYGYGDITNEDVDMSSFDYGLMKVPVIYSDNYDDDDDDSNNDANNKYSGTYLVSGPYYQAMYKPDASTISIDNEESEDDPDNLITQNTNTSKVVWAADGGDDLYDPTSCIVGVSFFNGLEIKDEYTNLSLDVFPNLRDCIEKDPITGNLLYDDDGKAMLDASKAGKDTSKNINEEGYYYIPENTLEIVISLNPYGLIDDDDATYGKAYPITIPLRSCKHNEVSINLSDLYGLTIYSIGIRVSNKKDDDGNLYASWKENKHPSLHVDDIIGLGNISVKGYNLKPYVPNIYTGNTQRWNWIAYDKNQLSQAYIFYQNKDTDGKNTKWSKLPIDKVNPAGSYSIDHSTGVDDNNDSITPLYLYTQYNTSTYVKTGTLSNVTQQKTEKSNRIKIIDSDNNVVRTSTDTANTIIFHIDAGDTKGPLFKIDTDVNLTPYDWIDIQYHLEIDRDQKIGSLVNEQINATNTGEENYFAAEQEIMKGEIIFDLYDTTDITNATPVEELALPAWGKIQERYGHNQTEYVNKVAHAWFKLHTDASEIKCIVLRKENPTNRLIPDIDLVLKNIMFLNIDSVPAFGPQMQVRIYPKDMDVTKNTKIRKFGCVYRLG